MPMTSVSGVGSTPYQLKYIALLEEMRANHIDADGGGLRRGREYSGH